MKANRRLWPRIFVAFVALTALILFLNRPFEKKTESRPKASPPPIPVVTATAKKGNQSIYLTGLGSVTPLNTVTLRSRVDGELLSVVVREGQMVSAGDLIAQIDPRPFEVQLMQAEAQSERDKAILENSKVDLERYRILYSQDSIPKQQLDTHVAVVLQNEAVIKSDQAAIESAKLNLTYTRITAPITGRIGLRLIDPGNIIHATDQSGLAVITQLQPITVIFNLPQDDILPVMKKLVAGAQLGVDAYDRELRNKIATGTLLTVDNQADVSTGTVRLKAVFSNDDLSLFPNQFVNARLLVDVKRGAVLVPAAAIQRGPESAFVYAVTPEGAVEARNVVVGPIEGNVAAIEKGVAPGDVVVTQGIDKLRPGAQVQVMEEPQ